MDEFPCSSTTLWILWTAQGFLLGTDLIISCLNYCTSLLTGLPPPFLLPLRFIHHSMPDWLMWKWFSVVLLLNSDSRWPTRKHLRIFVWHSSSSVIWPVHCQSPFCPLSSLRLHSNNNNNNLLYQWYLTPHPLYHISKDCFTFNPCSYYLFPYLECSFPCYLSP